MVAQEFRARRDAYAIELDGEMLIWLDDLQQLHRLNVPASRVWSMLEGWTNAEEIADAIADAQRERNVIGADVAACIEQFVALGLVDCRALPAPRD